MFATRVHNVGQFLSCSLGCAKRTATLSCRRVYNYCGENSSDMRGKCPTLLVRCRKCPMHKYNFTYKHFEIVQQISYTSQETVRPGSRYDAMLMQHDTGRGVNSAAGIGSISIPTLRCVSVASYCKPGLKCIRKVCRNIDSKYFLHLSTHYAGNFLHITFGWNVNVHSAS